MRKYIFFIFLFLLFSGCASKSNVKPNLSDYLTPFDGLNYDNVTVRKEGHTIYVKARYSEIDGEDIYVFVDENGTLVLKSYCLEAIPENVKLEAIEIALSNETIAKNAKGVVTVRRILPQTAEKFYEPKELLSVTWHGTKVVSALIDLEERRVVSVYVS